MTGFFDQQIAQALGAGSSPGVHAAEQGCAELPSCFRVSELAAAATTAAAREMAALLGANRVDVDRRLASMWFDMTLRPKGWELPSAWDPIAGDYAAADGWIRLHTNAPHHRDAALSVLGSPPDRSTVSEAVASWGKDDLETAVVAAGGAAAAMHALADWAAHRQGKAVAAEPLIAFRETGAGASPVAMPGLRVLDLTRVLAGPVATRFLAGFGAEVLRIDPPWWDEPGVVPEVSLGKRRTGLNLKQAADRATFKELLKGADVLVHGYRPGALEALGYGAEARGRIAPGLIDVSLNAYGWTGPWSGRRGFDSLVQMSCGIADEGMRRTGATRPVPLPVQALDHATGCLMAAAVLRALRQRNAEGRVLSAQLSLARTAALLIAAGPREMTGAPIEETPGDLAPEIEQTGWGPARRLRFPVCIDGQPPRWDLSAGPLRVDAPRWSVAQSAAV
ncbi:CoA transferase [Alloyangia pacifica]|uniref:CoA-transferase family III n=1 Tax=Alloyangia pacifica TaxID=311180 RepID=A0A1I6PE77_9RHOB|nr:CoA transferase [Alloyangia pacifica]SDG25498.1 CoA-transferase family III [Alloyangia pacifica]SFS38395.1 CoA-transferase family III [Alloyangia pacifica]